MEISFNEPLDQALLIHTIEIIDENKEQIKGTVLVLEEEYQWKFIPKNNWEPGNYQLRIRTSLEDLAGNNFNRPFDRDLWKEAAPPKESAFLFHPFNIK